MIITQEPTPHLSHISFNVGTPTTHIEIPIQASSPDTTFGESWAFKETSATNGQAYRDPTGY